jgi:hypothetical protein
LMPFYALKTKVLKLKSSIKMKEKAISLA